MSDFNSESKGVSGRLNTARLRTFTVEESEMAAADGKGSFPNSNNYESIKGIINMAFINYKIAIERVFSDAKISALQIEIFKKINERDKKEFFVGLLTLVFDLFLPVAGRMISRTAKEFIGRLAVKATQEATKSHLTLVNFVEDTISRAATVGTSIYKGDISEYVSGQTSSIQLSKPTSIIGNENKISPFMNILHNFADNSFLITIDNIKNLPINDLNTIYDYLKQNRSKMNIESYENLIWDYVYKYEIRNDVIPVWIKGYGNRKVLGIISAQGFSNPYANSYNLDPFNFSRQSGFNRGHFYFKGWLNHASLITLSTEGNTAKVYNHRRYHKYLFEFPRNGPQKNSIAGGGLLYPNISIQHTYLEVDFINTISVKQLHGIREDSKNILLHSSDQEYKNWVIENNLKSMTLDDLKSDLKTIGMVSCATDPMGFSTSAMIEMGESYSSKLLHFIPISPFNAMYIELSWLLKNTSGLSKMNQSYKETLTYFYNSTSFNKTVNSFDLWYLAYKFSISIENNIIDKITNDNLKYRII